MNKINFFHQTKDLLLRNKDGSHATQAARYAILRQFSDDLKCCGYYNLPVTGLKTKHIDAVVSKWVKSDLTAGTLKNRMSQMRWLAEKIGKKNIVARDNTHYGIDRRVYVTNASKAVQLPADVLEAIKDQHLKASLMLQEAFGLRREESIKFSPSYAIKEGQISLKGSWCKGGRERSVPIRNEQQRAALVFASEVAGKGSLIPADLKYIDQLRKYEGCCKANGLHHLHGLRHDYAQRRFKELTGFNSPACGGKTSKQLTTDEKIADLAARLQISAELGHNREQITAVYLGR